MMRHPYSPTPHEDIPGLLASLKPGDLFCDLGAGDGRMLIAARERGAVAVGYELDAELIRKTADTHGIAQADFMAQDWSGFDLLAINCDCAFVQPILDKFERDGKRGARLAVYTLGEYVHA